MANENENKSSVLPQVIAALAGNCCYNFSTGSQCYLNFCAHLPIIIQIVFVKNVFFRLNV
jgi:hypothetical protein